MSFNSLDKILNAIEQQSDWEPYRQFCRLLYCWRQVVTPQIAENTRPLSISRNVLWVATSSSVWAQTLSLQRHQLLKKLNAELSESLKDIRFSPAQWHDNRVNAVAEAEPPSYIEIPPEVLAVSESPPGNTPESTFQRWAQATQARAKSWNLCPQCQCPTPPGELKRWNTCSFCAAKQWQSPAS